MNFTHFNSNIPKIQTASLGGLISQFRLAPKGRVPYSEDKIKAANPKNASVLALFYPDKDKNTRLLLTLRASYKGVHSAQISFPGGKSEQSDVNFEYTAKRETFEEIGVHMEDITIIKKLTKSFIPPSNFLITPFIGHINYTPQFIPNNEVDTIIEVKLSDLLDDKNIAIQNMTTSYQQNIDVPCFKLNNYVVWGATAMILSEIKDLIKAL